MVTKAAKPKPSLQEIERLQAELETTRQNLASVNLFLEKVQNFSEVVSDARTTMKDLVTKRNTIKEELAEINDEIKSVQNLIDSSNDAMLSVLEPGPSKFMPLFDHMEKADPKTHGKNADQWREKPISVLRLSPAASSALIEHDIVFIGQLQDLILADPDGWSNDIPGLTDAMAAAIADKLTDFVKRGGRE